MKTAAKVFIILGMIGVVLGALIIGISINGVKDEVIANLVKDGNTLEVATQAYNIVFIIFVVISCIGSVVNIIIGLLTLLKLNKATEKKQLTAYGVLCLIFNSLIAGIMILCLKDDDLLN